MSTSDAASVSCRWRRSNPVWPHNGTELFFVDSERSMNTARVDASSGFRVLEREVLFTLMPELFGHSTGALCPTELDGAHSCSA